MLETGMYACEYKHIGEYNKHINSRQSKEATSNNNNNSANDNITTTNNGFLSTECLLWLDAVLSAIQMLYY